MMRLLRWLGLVTISTLIMAMAVWSWGRHSHTLDQAEISIDRIDADWRYGKNQTEFNLVTRNVGSRQIGGQVIFEIALDLTRVPIGDLQELLPKDKEALLKAIEDASAEGRESAYLDAVHDYLKGDLDTRKFKGYLPVNIPDGEPTAYRIRSTKHLTLKPGETQLVTIVVVIPTHYTPRKTTIRAIEYSKW